MHQVYQGNDEKGVSWEGIQYVCGGTCENQHHERAMQHVFKVIGENRASCECHTTRLPKQRRKKCVISGSCSMFREGSLNDAHKKIR